jgi:hypothetical protein
MRKLLSSKLLGSSGVSMRKPKERPVLVAGLTTDGKARVEVDDPRGGNFCNQAYLYMVPGTFRLLIVLILAFLQLYRCMVHSFSYIQSFRNPSLLSRDSEIQLYLEITVLRY